MMQEINPPAIVRQHCASKERIAKLKGLYEIRKTNKQTIILELVALREECIQEQREWLEALKETGIPARTAQNWLKDKKTSEGDHTQDAHRRQSGEEERPVLCSKCARNLRVGKPVKKNCHDCRELARAQQSDADETDYSEKPKDCDNHGRKKKRKRKPAEHREALVDAVGNPIPDRCRDAYADPSLRELVETLRFIEEQQEVDPWTKKVGDLTSHYPFILLDKFAEHSWESKHRLQLAIESAEVGIPYAVCPTCKGMMPNGDGKICRMCRGSGLIPKHRWEEYQRDAAQSVG